MARDPDPEPSDGFWEAPPTSASRGPRRRPVACTSHSLCNALGVDSTQVIERLYRGESGLRPPSQALPFETVCGEVAGRLPPLPPALAAYDSRLARLALALIEPMRGAIDAAVRRWGAARVAIVLGTSTGGLAETEAAHRAILAGRGLPASYSLERTHALSAATDLLAAVLGIEGLRFVVSTACSSSAKALSSGHRLIDAGMADAVLAGGIDTLCELTVRGFHSLGILSSRAARPFGSEREGINIGEGGALVLLEREGAAAVHLWGAGETADAHHMSAPHPEGDGAEEAMRRALEAAGVTPAQIGHINSHGTGTPLNDAAEARAIGRVFGRRVPVVSTKGYTGHMLGAAGATEAVFTMIALERRELPASLGSWPVDPALAGEIDVPQAPRAVGGAFAISNSFAFGGSNIALVFGSADGR
jgi:3-oxoacyl-[acyl-carrier-protein] synthase-1